MFGWFKKKEHEFKGFKKIPRTENMVCEITEKLDGTNGVILIKNRTLVAVGSKNRWLSAEHDLAAQKDTPGFYSWCYEPEREAWLKQLDDGYYYGEFIGKGIQRTYDLNHRRFYLFRYDLKEKMENERLGIYTIPHLCTCNLETLESSLRSSRTVLLLKGSFVNDFEKTEGLVVTMGDRRYKHIWDK